MGSSNNITKGAPCNVYINGRDIGYCTKASINYKLLEEAVKLGCPKELICKLPEEIESGAKVTGLEVFDPTNMADALGGLDITTDGTFGVGDLEDVTDATGLMDYTGSYVGLGSAYEKDEPSVTIVHKNPKTQYYLLVHYWKTNISMANELELGDAVAQIDFDIQSLKDADHSPNYHGIWWWQTEDYTAP
jgi:hypothetical protein